MIGGYSTLDFMMFRSVAFQPVGVVINRLVFQQNSTLKFQRELDRILIRAVEHESLVSVKKALELGAGVNAKNNWQIPAIVIASMKGNLEIVKLLISRGASRKDIPKALEWARERGYFEVLEFLTNQLKSQ